MESLTKFITKCPSIGLAKDNAAFRQQHLEWALKTDYSFRIAPNIILQVSSSLKKVNVIGNAGMSLKLTKTLWL